eukprot:TRINITY_DN66393_c9_g5_i2.p2 TRINITY_DN66393_c9_g5~~TRINITY_DN66393_c9_g5_i2.p2  ORF type:complete len:143 (-),score=12.00 TRINITY_DN66393_c9_g5_i2:965-1393(-)
MWTDRMCLQKEADYQTHNAPAKQWTPNCLAVRLSLNQQLASNFPNRVGSTGNHPKGDLRCTPYPEILVFCTKSLPPSKFPGNSVYIHKESGVKWRFSKETDWQTHNAQQAVDTQLPRSAPEFEPAAGFQLPEPPRETTPREI